MAPATELPLGPVAVRDWIVATWEKTWPRAEGVWWWRLKGMFNQAPTDRLSPRPLAAGRFLSISSTAFVLVP